MRIETPQQLRPYTTSTQTLTVLRATQDGHLGGRDYMHLCLVRLADGKALEGIAYMGTMRSHDAANVRDDMRRAAHQGTPVVAAVRAYARDEYEAGKPIHADVEIVDYVLPEADEPLGTCECCEEQLPGVRNQLNIYEADVHDRTVNADLCVTCAYQLEMDV